MPWLKFYIYVLVNQKKGRKSKINISLAVHLCIIDVIVNTVGQRELRHTVANAPKTGACVTVEIHTVHCLMLSL